MSIGRNKGSSSESNKASTQATNYGRDQTTISAGKNQEVTVEDLSDEALKKSLNFASEESSDALNFAQHTYDKSIESLSRRAVAQEKQVESATETIEQIASDKATSVQKSQRMTVIAVVGVVGVVLYTRSRSD
jgi:hypothetical protein